MKATVITSYSIHYTKLYEVHSDGDRAYVRGPIQPGERIIVEGLQRVTPGMPVTPRDSQRANLTED